MPLYSHEIKKKTKPWNLLFTCLNFSHLQSTLHWMQYTYRDIFSTAQNSFRTCQFWCLLLPLLFFVSPLPPRWNVSLWGVFHHPGKQTNKKSHLGWDWVNREACGMGVMPFLAKSMVWAGALVNHPSWNGQTPWKSLQKNSLKPNAASHNNTS